MKLTEVRCKVRVSYEQAAGDSQKKIGVGPRPNSFNCPIQFFALVCSNLSLDFVSAFPGSIQNITGFQTCLKSTLKRMCILLELVLFSNWLKLYGWWIIIEEFNTKQGKNKGFHIIGCI